MEKFIERIAKAPLVAKIVAVLVAVGVVTALNLYVTGVPPGRSIAAIDKQMKVKENELTKASAEYGEKKNIANDLNRFRRERELLEQRFNEAKAELPDQNKIDELLQSFQDRAQKAGLEIVKVEPKPQIQPSQGEFYAKIPIAMQVEGNFHEIATYFDALGHLRRIVNVSDIVLDGPRDVNGRVVLNAKFTATSFMFAEPKPATGAAKGAKKGGAK
jgi:type IV pilus assembly protein PilO